jgi:hypothetical protein
MGMFDRIKNKLYCPYCGKKQKEYDFQSKDFGSTMGVVDILKVKMDTDYNIYSSCKKCNNWIELTIHSHLPIHTITQGKKEIKQRKKETKELFEVYKK